MAFDKFQTVTPSDTVDLPQWTANQRLTDALWVGGAGNIVLVAEDGSTVTINAVPAGTQLNVGVRRVNATNTTATGIVALYNI